MTSWKSPQFSDYYLEINYIKLLNYIGQQIIQLDRISGLNHWNLCDVECFELVLVILAESSKT